MFRPNLFICYDGNSLNSNISPEEIRNHFPNIVDYCRDKGYDVFKECIPVVPAQHYFMGGIKVNKASRTSMEQLYAIGETACNGVHGRNRLASNSLLESLVFAKRAAKEMTEIPGTADSKNEIFQIDISAYQDEKELAGQYRQLVLNEIERLNQSCTIQLQ